MRKWIRGAALLAALTASLPALAQGTASGGTSSPPPKTALQLMLQKGVITQAEYDAAVAAPGSTEVVKEVRETIVVQESPKLNPPPVTSKWAATMYGFIEADFIFDSTQSFADLAGNGIIAANGYAAKNHRLQFSVRNTRLGFRFAAPEWGSVKSSAVLEMDFFGNQPSNPPPAAGSLVSEAGFFNNPGMRIRHAYMKLESPVVDFLFGQTWELFGWQSYFHPNTVDLQGVPAQVYSRTIQARVSKTIKSDPVNVEIAIAASRPPQRDSYVPDGQAGLKFNVNNWKGVTTAGGTGTSILAASLAASGTWRRFQVQQFNAANGNPNSSAVTQGWGYSLDALVPIIPVSGTDRSNAMTFTGSFVNGTAINDLYTGLTGGLGNPASTPGLTPATGYVPNIDSGYVMFSADGKLHTINWRSFILGLQYYLPGSGRVWVSANYANIYSTNIAQYANPANVFQRAQFADGNIFWDATNAVRFGLEYAWFFQNRPNGDTATNNRVQFSAFYLF
jgi:hypothetical protein